MKKKVIQGSINFVDLQTRLTRKGDLTDSLPGIFQAKKAVKSERRSPGIFMSQMIEMHSADHCVVVAELATSLKDVKFSKQRPDGSLA